MIAVQKLIGSKFNLKGNYYFNQQQPKLTLILQWMKILSLIDFNLVIFYYFNNTMISHVITKSLPYFRFIVKPHLFYFSTVNSRANEKGGKQVLRIQNCSTIAQLIECISKSQNKMPYNKLKQVYEKVNTLKPTFNAWDNLFHLNQKLNQADIASCDLDTLTNIAGMLSIMNQYQLFGINKFIEVRQRVVKLLQQSNKLSSEQIIKFLDVAVEFYKVDLIQQLVKELASRISTLQFKDYHLYLEYVSRRKIPTKGQKQIFTKFITKVSQQTEQFNLRFVINLYRELKKLNRSIYIYGDVLKQLESRIEGSIDKLNDKEISLLLNFKSQHNIFLPTIYKHLMDSIDENGDSSRPSKSIFNLLLKLTHNESFSLSQEIEPKFMKFLQKNSHEITAFNRLIKKNFFSHQQLITIKQIVLGGTSALLYLQDSLFIYYLTSRGIYFDNYYPFLSNVKAQNPISALSEKYLASALIVNKLLSLDPTNSEIQSINEHFSKITESFQKSSRLLKNLFFLNNNRLVRHFHRAFGSVYAKHIVEDVIANKQKLTTSFLLYLISANDYKSFQKILKAKHNLIQFSIVKPILHKIQHHPSHFIGTFDFISKALKDTEIDKGSMRYVANYLCNWEVHLLLQPDEFQSFLQLARKVIAADCIRETQIYDFFRYLSNSPDPLIKNNSEYMHLLDEVQQKMVHKEGNNRDYLAVFFGLELMWFNRMNKKYAQKMLSRLQRDEILERYCKIVTGQKLNWSQIKITPENFILFAKAKDITESEIEKLFSKLQQIIQKCTLTQRQDALINFQMKNCEKGKQIFNFLLDTYTFKLIPDRKNIKVDLIFNHIQKMNLNTPQYKSFLTKIANIYAKNMKIFPTSEFSPLLYECRNKNVECQEYIDKLIQHFQSQVYQGQMDPSKILLILDSMTLADPEQAFRLYKCALESTQYKSSSQILASLNLINPADESIQKEIFKLFQNSKVKQVEIYEETYRYLTAKNPKFRQLQGKIKLTKIEEDIAKAQQKLVQTPQYTGKL